MLDDHAIQYMKRQLQVLIDSSTTPFQLFSTIGGSVEWLLKVPLFTTSRGVVATVTYLREEDRSKRF